MDDQVHANQSRTDQGHGIDIAALGQGGNQPPEHRAPIGPNDQGRNQKEHPHQADKNLHNGLQGFIGANPGRGQGEQTDEDGRRGNRQAADIRQTAGSADFVARLEGKAGNQHRQKEHNTDQPFPDRIFRGHRHRGIHQIHAGGQGGAGRHLHQDNKCNSREHQGPQQGIAETNARHRTGCDGARTDERAGDNRGRSHILHTLSKALFHSASFLSLVPSFGLFVSSPGAVIDKIP